MKQFFKKIFAREVLILLGLALIMGGIFIICPLIQSAKEKRIEQIKSEIEILKNEFKLTFAKTIQKDDDYIKELFDKSFSKKQKEETSFEKFSHILSTNPDSNLSLYNLDKKYHNSNNTDYVTFSAKTGLTKNEKYKVTSNFQRLYIYLLRDSLYNNSYSDFLNNIKNEKFQKKIYDSVYRLGHFTKSFETFQTKLLVKGDDLKPKSEIVKELESIQLSLNNKYLDLNKSIDSYFNVKKYNIIKFLILLSFVIIFPFRYLVYLLIWSIRTLKK